MINIKPKVYEALQNDATLISLLGGIITNDSVTYNRIYQLMAPNANEFPRLVFWEMDNIGANFADDEEQESEISIQIDIYTKNQSTSDIAKEVDNLMKSIGFFRTASTDQYNEDNDTQIYEKHMRYSITIANESEE
jgi:hypothetical protein